MNLPILNFPDGKPETFRYVGRQPQAVNYGEGE